MNIKHAFARFFGLHPLRRVGEVNYTSAAEVVRAGMQDAIRGQRRHDDSVNKARASFAAAEAAAKRGVRLTPADPYNVRLTVDGFVSRC